MKVKITYLCVMTFCVMTLLSCGKKELELVAVEEASEEGVTGVAAGDAGASGLGDGVSGADASDDVVGSGPESDTSGDVSGENRIYVFIYGAVNHPGVYEIREGARLYELISLAGGYSQDASVGYNNLAREIFDGEQIYVPTNGEVAESVTAGGSGVVGAGGSASASDASGANGTSGASGTSDGGQNKLVNINTATREELMTLSGIGESRANDIISYRNQYGPFRSIEEIQNVSGIKTGIYEKIKEFITI